MVRKLKPAKLISPLMRWSSRAASAAVLGTIIAGSPLTPMLHGGLAFGAEAQQQQAVKMDVDKATLIQLSEPASTVFIANPDIADVQVPVAPNATNVIVFGKKAGATTLYAMSANGKLAEYPVEVSRPTEDIAAALRKQVPNADVQVSSAPNGITVTGSARSPADVQQLKNVARQYLGDKDSANVDVAVQSSTQVTLRVRVVEVSKSVNKNFGFNWNGIFDSGTIAIGLLQGRLPTTDTTNPTTGVTTRTFNPGNAADTFGSVGAGFRDGRVDVAGLVDALQAEGLITVLAEPTLTSVSGETASFLSGGEFPVPVSQGLQQITIEWKRFGVNVDFAPTVLSGDHMSIKVRPEVSELTDTGSVVVNNIKIPGLAVRRAETTVELGSGQSFAIAGLFQNNVSSSLQQLPGLGDLPVLGTLFRSSKFQRNESELVIIVTPYIVHPADGPGSLHVPTEGLAFSSDLERILLGRLTARGDGKDEPIPTADTPHLNGAAGFILEH